VISTRPIRNSKSFRHAPHNVDALYYLSKVSGILSQIEFRELYSLAPNSARVHQLIGESYQMQEDLPKARKNSCRRWRPIRNQRGSWWLWVM
jgi:hypothetical protein